MEARRREGQGKDSDVGGSVFLGAPGFVGEMYREFVPEVFS